MSNVEITDFSIQGLKSILCDAYWCHLDSYAHFLWDQLSEDTQNVLINDLEFLTDYIPYLDSIAPEETEFFDDPYYLHPLPIDHIDNETLTEVIKRYPALLYQISSVRLNHLHLSAKDKLRLGERVHEDIPKKNELLLKVEATPFRLLKRPMLIEFSSVQEEEELLTAKDLSFESKMSAPSLGWLAELPEFHIREILRAYSAQDLANVWTGPSYVLEKLKISLPEKKYNLMIDYQNKIKPSRAHPLFLKIHRETMLCYKEVFPEKTTQIHSSKGLFRSLGPEPFVRLFRSPESISKTDSY